MKDTLDDDVSLTRWAITIAESKVGPRSDISLHDYGGRRGLAGVHRDDCRWCDIKKRVGLI